MGTLTEDTGRARGLESSLSRGPADIELPPDARGLLDSLPSPPLFWLTGAQGNGNGAKNTITVVYHTTTYDAGIKELLQQNMKSPRGAEKSQGSRQREDLGVIPPSFRIPSQDYPQGKLNMFLPPTVLSQQFFCICRRFRNSKKKAEDDKTNRRSFAYIQDDVQCTYEFVERVHQLRDKESTLTSITFCLEFQGVSLLKPCGKKASKRLRQVTDFGGEQSFQQFAELLLQDNHVKEKIEKAKAEAKQQHLPLLGDALEKNSKARILLVAESLCGKRLAASHRKGQLVSMTLLECTMRIPAESLGTLNTEVGDIGVAKVPVTESQIEQGEMVFLKCNGKTPTFAQCVSESPFLLGYVVQDGGVRQVEVPSSALAWGRLAECRKDNKLT